MINAFTASLPDRFKTLEKSVKSILPQVDTMQVVLNNYKSVPKFLEHEKITVVRHDNSLEDGSRFINIERESGYTLVFDDDILYPSNYVERMIECIEYLTHFHDQEVIVGPMGKVLKPRPIRSYYQNIDRSYKTFSEVNHHYVVDVIGACGIMWNAEKVKITQDIIQTPNSDLCVAKFAKENNVLQICVAHKAGWLINLMTELSVQTPSIFRKYRHKDEKLTEFVNKWI